MRRKLGPWIYSSCCETYSPNWKLTLTISVLLLFLYMLWTYTRRKQFITLNLFLNCVGEIQMFCTLIATMERVLLSVFGLWNMQNICKCCIFNWSLHGFVLIMWKCSLFKYLYFKCLLHWGLILLEEIKKKHILQWITVTLQGTLF